MEIVATAVKSQMAGASWIRKMFEKGIELKKKVGADSLRDRRGVVFPILREGKRDIIFNSLPTYMGDRRELLAAAGIKNEHFIFTLEGPKEAQTVLAYHQKGLPLKKEVRRIK